MQYVTTHPIYPNKFCLYHENDSHYNWFMCGKPITITKNGKKQEIIEIGDQSLFFEKTTGFTYKINSEDLNTKTQQPVTLLILKSCKNVTQDLESATNLGFQGVAYTKDHKNQESHKNNQNNKNNKNSTKRDMICSNVVLIFNKDWLQLSKRCIYTEFCHVHPDIRNIPNHAQNSGKSLDSRNNMLKYIENTL